MNKQARKYLLKRLRPALGVWTARLGPNEKPARGAFTPPLPVGYWREKPQHTPEEIALHHRLHVARHH